MRLYTKVGDEGFTNRPGDQRVRKCDPRIDAVGVVDELNAVLGWSVETARDEKWAEVRDALLPLQGELLTAGALLAAAGTGVRANVELDEGAVARMEQQIDSAWEKLPELKHFVLPKGCELACRLHIARTISRRAERSIAGMMELENQIAPVIPKYFNRLSDLLFALGRLVNQIEGLEEQTWEPDCAE